MNFLYLVSGMGIVVGGIGLILNYLASTVTIKYLKGKQAFSTDTATRLDEIGALRYNWIFFAENPVSIIRRTADRLYYLDQANLERHGGKIKLQLIIGIFVFLMGVALVTLSLIRNFS